MTAIVIFKAEDVEGISLLVRPHCDHCPVTPVCRCIRPVAGKEKSNQVKISLHEISVVSRKAEAGTRVGGEAVANLDRALHRLDDEDDGDQAGEAFLREASDVADKEAAEKHPKSTKNQPKNVHLASVATSMMSMAASQSPIQMRKDRYSQPKPKQN